VNEIEIEITIKHCKPAELSPYAYPNRLAPVVAAEGDARKVHEILSNEDRTGVAWLGAELQ